jgi:L-threonylcarbamoyladenylate synthase
MQQAPDRNPVILGSASPRAIEWAAEAIVDGGVIALPTDTVYGLAAALTHPAALERIYEIKGRDLSKTLPILISSPDMLGHLAYGIDARIALLLEKFWPGPLTMVVPAASGLADAVVAPDGTIGVRMPNHSLALEVIGKAGGMVACTSANRSGQPPARTSAEVAATIGRLIDLTLDGGITPGGVPSTVLAIRSARPVVLREGAISVEEIAAAWEELILDTDL